MQDPTELLRRELVVAENTERDRATIAAQHGEVWDTAEVAKAYDVLGFMAPFVIVRNKVTGKRGTLTFQHFPRFYYDWQEENQ